MTALIHVKRRIEEDPLDAFILNCKVRKIESESSSSKNGEASTIVKYAGTFNNQETILDHVKNLAKEEAKNILSKVHKPSLTARNRLEYKKNVQESRFKIVNCYRPVENECDDTKDSVTVVEVEKEDLSSADDRDNDKAKTEPNFVYDLYFPEENPVDCKIEMDNLVSISAYDDSIYDAYRTNKDNESSGHETDDSNDENNWRNDYPDTENDSSIDDEDMRRAVEDLDLGERDLSSDAEDERYYVHSIDTTNDDFEADIDSTDVLRYGKAYARYKAKNLRRFNDSDDDDDDEDESEQEQVSD